MDKPKTTPKDFFLWAGAMVALYVGVFNFIALIWNYIDYTFPDPLAYYPSDPYQGGISWEMATLIVLSPLFLVLMRFIRKSIQKDPTRKEIWIRRWALFLTLFIAGATAAIDLIWVLYAFLNGTDITTSFLLKAAVVLGVSAVGFMHFMADLWGYWEQYPERNKMVSYATGVLVILTVIAGFFIVGTPQQARLYRFDSQKVSDLQNIQYQIVNYWQQKESLPATLEDLHDPLSGSIIPFDPQTGAAYTYKRNSPLDFALCATFNAESRGTGQGSDRTMPIPAGMGGKAIQDNWQHGVGEVCFDRSIDPQRYPPYSKTNI